VGDDETGGTRRTALLDSSGSFGISFSELILKAEQTALYTTKRKGIARACSSAAARARRLSRGSSVCSRAHYRVRRVVPQHPQQEKKGPSSREKKSRKEAQLRGGGTKSSFIIQERWRETLFASRFVPNAGSHRGIAMLVRYRASNGVPPGRMYVPQRGVPVRIT